MKQINDIRSKNNTKRVFGLENDNVFITLAGGVQHEVGDFIQLELTAEQMLQQEAAMVSDYLTMNTQCFWSDLKCELHYWEINVAAMLLGAANPVDTDWRFHLKTK